MPVTVSYDLYFCARESRSLPLGDLVAWSSAYKPFRQSAESQLFYENQDTGVYFSIEQMEPDDLNELDVPEDVFLVGLSFNLNYLRPKFFAIEAFPIVESLAREFDLIMLDPQADGDVKFKTHDELLDSWSKNNRWAVDAFVGEGGSDLNYLSPKKSLDFWKYMRGYESLCKELQSDDVFVPRQVLIATENSQEAGTAIVWTQGISLVVPETDWIFVVYPKNVWRRENKVVIFSTETVLTPLRQYLRDYDADRGLRILPPEHLGRSDKVLKTLEGGLSPAMVSRLVPDKCVECLSASL